MDREVCHVLKSTAELKTANHASKSAREYPSSFAIILSSSISLTAAGVSQGCRYQQGMPKMGWSPCDNSGKLDIGFAKPKELFSVPSNADL
jgi:hypothetical protein